MKSTLPSICIPRVFSNITKKDVVDAFEKILGRNCIDRIDMIYKRDGINGYQRVFVHFKKINQSDNYDIMIDRFTNEQDVKVVYSEPWFWKCSVSRVAKPTRY
uniref:RRM domain-containing protein n=1 Tax=viral metagenome TaxID=1070528 RepID=A0A6C0LIK0_9ZZZZ